MGRRWLHGMVADWPVDRRCLPRAVAAAAAAVGADGADDAGADEKATT